MAHLPFCFSFHSGLLLMSIHMQDALVIWKHLKSIDIVCLEFALLPDSGQLIQLSDSTVSVKTREAGKKPQTTIPNQTTTKKTLFPQRSFLKYLRFSYWKSCRSLHCFFSVAALHHVLCSSSFCLPFFTLCTLFSFSYSSFHCSFSFLCPSFSFPRRRLYSCCSSCP